MKNIAVMVTLCLLGVALFAQTEDVLSLQDAIALYEDDKTLTDDGDRVIEIIKDLLSKGIDTPPLFLQKMMNIIIMIVVIMIIMFLMVRMSIMATVVMAVIPHSYML